MRMSDKAHSASSSADQLFNVGFREFISREQDNPFMEASSEFGVSSKDIKKLKKHLGRS